MNTVQLRDAYVAQRPRFELLARSVERSLKSAVRTAGLTHVTLSSRAKDVQSFVRKALVKNYSDPLGEIQDTAGVRAVIQYRQHEECLSQLLYQRFTVLDRVDKRAELSDDQLGYMGLHFVVTPKRGAGVGLLCEVQVRTMAEDVWATMSHTMLYKAPTVLDPIERRQLFRLSALSEVFDKEADGAWTNFLHAPGYLPGLVLELLERHFFRLTGYLRVDALSSEVVGSVLLPGYSPEQQGSISTLLDNYVANNEGKLREVLARYRRDDRHLYLQRPESLMIFEQLDRDPFSLEQRWSAKLSFADLRGMGDVWGIAIAQEDA